MADTTASNPGGSCLEKLKSYVRTQKGFILGAEIVSSLTFTPKCLFSVCAVFTELIKQPLPSNSLRLITLSYTCLLLFIAHLLAVEETFSN